MKEVTFASDGRGGRMQSQTSAVLQMMALASSQCSSAQIWQPGEPGQIPMINSMRHACPVSNLLRKLPLA